MAWMTPSSVTISSASWARCADPGQGWRVPFSRPGRRVLFAALALLALASPSGPLHAQASPFAGTVALTSQLVDRGLPITSNRPVLQGELNWNAPSGWSLGAAAASEMRSTRLAEGLLHVAYSWPVSTNWQMQASVLYYDAPRRGRSRGYRRVEADLAWIYRDILTFNLAALRAVGRPDAHTNPAAEANLRWPLTRHLSLLVGGGVARFQGSAYGYYRYYGEGPGYYRYGQAGLVWRSDRWRVELDRIATDGAPAARRGTGGLSPWMASMSWSF